MGKKRKPTYPKKSFESTGVSWDTSANIYMSMLLSEAWRALTPAQAKLYIYCKAQLYAEKKTPITIEGKTQDEYFTMNRSKWCKLYGLYQDGNRKGFHRDMNALIEKGFVEYVENNRSRRRASIYALSSNWKNWKLDAEVNSS